ncbi:MAG: class I SAM-dependent methyltransferase [Acidimicrobiales bacterium]
MLDVSERAPESGCRICGTPMDPVGVKRGKFSGRVFDLARCPRCGFAAVTNPWLDYEQIYNDAYYEGRGADPDINYVEAARDPESAVQSYEWRGILDHVARLSDVRPSTAWLDYGCGTGGLVGYLVGRGYPQVVGFEQGWAETRLEENQVPHLSGTELGERAGTFDVVTAIEVIEHAIDPISELRAMRQLLRPGGLLFISTGNSHPYRERLDKWRYVKPEVHISFFDPRCLAEALTMTGFEVEFPGFGPGWTDIYRTKALMTIGSRHKHVLDALVPWGLAARGAEWRLRLAELPVGRVPR